MKERENQKTEQVAAKSPSPVLKKQSIPGRKRSKFADKIKQKAKLNERDGAFEGCHVSYDQGRLSPRADGAKSPYLSLPLLSSPPIIPLLPAFSPPSLPNPLSPSLTLASRDLAVLPRKNCSNWHVRRRILIRFQLIKSTSTQNEHQSRRTNITLW